MVLLLSAGVSVAMTTQGDVTTRANDQCDPANVDSSGVCAPTETGPAPAPPQADPSPPQDPPPTSSSPSPAPDAPAQAPCPDGTLPPCPAPEQSKPPAANKNRKLDCRIRPGHRRPKACPPLRQGERQQQAQGPRQRTRQIRRAAARERRRAARERRRAEIRRKCDSDGLIRFGGTPGQCRNAVDGAGFIVGRLASRPLPDPLPPGQRLDGGFAKLLNRTAGRQWPLVLATLRAKGKTGSSPASAKEIRKLAKQRGGAADERVQALADYNRAVGLAGLTQGLAAVKGDLIDRVLSNSNISIYGAGRSDVSSGAVDVRVLVTMLYLAEREGSITVTSLISGHGIFTKSGHLSLHTSGRAMDIAAVGGTPILGNQQPGGVTEGTLRNVMLMPSELRPTELISLFALGGPSFALADHADHIHVGY